ncbi:MAG: hypothetical protein II304_06555 [Bacteroidales bacterium]|nr:hypothetical protein [Bacteroidales bacterium]
MKKKNFPKVRFVFNVVLALIFGGAAPLAETFVQNNVQTATVMQNLENGINSGAMFEGLLRLPHFVSIVCIIIALLFIAKAISLIVNYFKD